VLDDQVWSLDDEFAPDDESVVAELEVGLWG
jgi:hypothetical protein